MGQFLVPDWTAGSTWLYLETPTVETKRQIRQKFEARNNQNLVDRFAKRDERAALMPQWHAAKAELARFRGYRKPTFDMSVRAFLVSVIARDFERCTLRTQVLAAHVNLPVWRDASSSISLLVSPLDPNSVVRCKNLLLELLLSARPYMSLIHIHEYR